MVVKWFTIGHGQLGIGQNSWSLHQPPNGPPKTGTTWYNPPVMTEAE